MTFYLDFTMRNLTILNTTIIEMVDLQTTRKPTANAGLAKVAVHCSADTFVVNQSLVLRINICGENRHLRQARKRYGQV
jgi:hypothetical protein